MWKSWWAPATPVCLVGVLTLAGCAPEQPETAAFIERLGADTMSIEVFTRFADRIEGRVLVRSPLTRVTTYTASLTPAGVVDRLEVVTSTPAENPDGPPQVRTSVLIERDTALVVRDREDLDTLTVPVPPNTIPVVSKTPIPVAFLQQAVMGVRTDVDTTPFVVLPAGGARATPNAIVRRAADSVSFDFFGNPMIAAVGPDGRIQGLTGRETTLQVEIESIPPEMIDFDALAADFAARDARGEGLGVASPRDQVQASASGAEFEVDYSRPAKRGRTIWGGLVPYDEVWRTGANAATHFTSTRDLIVGNAPVPAGTYTLWSTFTGEGGTLIINRQTGQWGTQYDASQDLVRVPLTVRSLTQPVERFTIVIEEQPNGGVLKLVWDDREYSVAMRVAGR